MSRKIQGVLAITAVSLTLAGCFAFGNSEAYQRGYDDASDSSAAQLAASDSFAAGLACQFLMSSMMPYATEEEARDYLRGCTDFLLEENN